uniref:Carbonic anhydrase n=1 Tax=Pipistrellus kuhlii TaxID=59472 RepID=A0A7J7T0S9_PIPKU|nr:carbonic anhydrase 6 [Pipistrellus kuhlii]
MRPLVVLPYLSLLLLGALAAHDWTYTKGPGDETHWHEAYPTCGGDRQSPIDVQRRKVQYNPALGALNLTGYSSQNGSFSMINNGHTVQINLPHTMRMTTAEGTEYIAQQLHFHWGGEAREVSGSEHTIDGIRYPAEIHVVHYNSKYESFDVAKDAPDGLAVLAALIEIKDYQENTYYSDFISHLTNVRYSGQSTTLDSFDVQNMLPADLQLYYTYGGSLTTPPCTENVRWFLLADTVQLSKAQVGKLENYLVDDHHKIIQSIYRRTQPLNSRVVEANFVYHPNYQLALSSQLLLNTRWIDKKLDVMISFMEVLGRRRGRYHRYP